MAVSWLLVLRPANAQVSILPVMDKALTMQVYDKLCKAVDVSLSTQPLVFKPDLYTTLDLKTWLWEAPK